MMNFIKRIASSYKESNHDKHFKGGILVAVLGTILMAIGVAGGLEYKDKLSGGVWDWKDFWWTVAGGVVGQLGQVSIIYLIVAVWGAF